MFPIYWYLCVSLIPLLSLSYTHTHTWSRVIMFLVGNAFLCTCDPQWIFILKLVLLLVLGCSQQPSRRERISSGSSPSERKEDLPKKSPTALLLTSVRLHGHLTLFRWTMVSLRQIKSTPGAATELGFFGSLAYKRAE